MRAGTASAIEVIDDLEANSQRAYGGGLLGPGSRGGDDGRAVESEGAAGDRLPDSKAASYRRVSRQGRTRASGNRHQRLGQPRLLLAHPPKPCGEVLENGQQRWFTNLRFPLGIRTLVGPLSLSLGVSLTRP